MQYIRHRQRNLTRLHALTLKLTRREVESLGAVSSTALRDLPGSHARDLAATLVELCGAIVAGAPKGPKRR